MELHFSFVFFFCFEFGLESASYEDSFCTFTTTYPMKGVRTKPESLGLSGVEYKVIHDGDRMIDRPISPFQNYQCWEGCYFID